MRRWPHQGTAGLARVKKNPCHESMTPEERTILASSAPWLGALLNVVPGLGTGYIYQRRWRAYWITSVLAMAWFVLGALLDASPSMPDPGAVNPGRQLIGLAGLLLLAAVTAVEAFLKAARARLG
jgi:hypothetical protein